MDICGMSFIRQQNLTEQTSLDQRRPRPTAHDLFMIVFTSLFLIYLSSKEVKILNTCHGPRSSGGLNYRTLSESPLLLSLLFQLKVKLKSAFFFRKGEDDKKCFAFFFLGGGQRESDPRA